MKKNVLTWKKKRALASKKEASIELDSSGLKELQI